MKNAILLLPFVAITLLSCSERGLEEKDAQTGPYELTHEMIVLGDKMEDPYTLENMSAALASVYPTKAGRVDLQATDIYVRFLPKDQEEFRMLLNSGLVLFDHPIDYQIIKDGDYYHDPELPEDMITWQYAVVRPDFDFPSRIRYEILDQCYIADNDPAVRSGGDIDWDLVEREAYRISGNEEFIIPDSKALSAVARPSGRITVYDEDSSDGGIVGVAGVKLICHTFVKFSSTYTDADGYYKIDRQFSSKLRYRIVFQNEKGFAIGFNKVLLPASTSALGMEGPEGLSLTIEPASDRNLYCRSVVNNACYDYFEICNDADCRISPPPANTRLWLFQLTGASSAPMLQHGVLVDDTKLGELMGDYKSIVKMFLPDITLGLKGAVNYSTIYASAIHELAHASHFSQVGKTYWNKYVSYILKSFVDTGGRMYGIGEGENAGYCEIGEMWAYYLQNRLYWKRYGEESRLFGTDYWFKPHIFLYLEERGLDASMISKALCPEVKDMESLRVKLDELYPEYSKIIDQAFERYAD